MTFRKAETDKNIIQQHLDDTEGVLKHELIAYRIKDGKFMKELITVRYGGDEPLISSVAEPLFAFETVKEELPETKGAKKSKGIPRD